MMFRKKGQEEMIGFALIIVLVSVILLVFLWLSLSNSKTESLDNYEVDNFMQAFLQYTTKCEKNYGGYYSVQDLIGECSVKLNCGQKSSCEILNSTLKEILKNSWPIGENWPEKGYSLLINVDDAPLIQISEGNQTKNYKGKEIKLVERRKKLDLILYIYF